MMITDRASNLNKVAFYILLLIINIVAFMLIGMTFLSGPSAGGEGALQLDESAVFIRRCIYIVIVSAIFALLAFLTGYLFRRSVNIDKHGLKKIFIYELMLFLLVFLVSYIYVYISA